jgi:hypothetical protein
VIGILYRLSKREGFAEIEFTTGWSDITVEVMAAHS